MTGERSTDYRQDDPERQWDECSRCGCYRANHVTLSSGTVECITVIDEGTDNEHECECDGFQEVRS